MKFYNLDVIISVGYRVKSLEGTRFRQWANRVLKDYLVQGYALNQQRLEAQQAKLAELKQAIALPPSRPFSAANSAAAFHSPQVCLHSLIHTAL